MAAAAARAQRTLQPLHPFQLTERSSLDDLECLPRRSNCCVEITEPLANKRLGEPPLKLLEQTGKVTVGVDENDGFMVKAELLKRDDLQNLFEGAEATG